MVVRDRIIIFFLLVFQFLGISVIAQSRPGNHQRHRPALFSHLPEKFRIDDKVIDHIFSLSVSDSITILNKNPHILRVVVTAKNYRSDDNLSMNFKLLNFPGALVTISKVVNAKNQVVVSGRIMHPSFSDIYSVIKINDGYFFSRHPLKKFLTE